MNNILNEVKISLGLSSSDKDELLNSLIQRSSQQVKNYIKENSVPQELGYIVTELVISRYNRIGSEGLSSENSDGVSFSYNNNLLDNFKVDLDRYIANRESQLDKVKVRLI
ncbi:phage head-tail connector protein [Terrisporobacter muris]|uniref:Phage head-tail connector protein n=1 Tax=Terrisporobacter muris TaxID=2963284 RepID=A0A9X2S066_9FIRM|nr:phage head-tail connector protein [Terrisporobacter muris]MCR1821713.1 phage head-tail connector protein [Terrisporobacter muris]